MEETKGKVGGEGEGGAGEWFDALESVVARARCCLLDGTNEAFILPKGNGIFFQERGGASRCDY